MADPFHPGDRESDAALLVRYCSGDQSAFDRLAQRYLDFVYAAACRQVRDPHLAEDVTQAVFLLLSKKAPRVPGERLAGWLFRTTRYASLNARRMHARRQMHERQAAAHRTEHVMPSEIAEADPAILSLDDALASLSRGDRELVLMRYFQGREIPELCESLQLSEAACRKRLTRAIDKLRERFAAHGTQIEASAMILTLHAAAAQKAPAGLTVGASGSATAGSIAAAASLSMLAMKLKIAVAVLMIAGIGAIGVRGLRRTVASAPSTAPATAPVAAAPDDPRAVASDWAAAVASGDVERARSLVAGTAEELAMIDGLASAVAAAESLNQFANEKFGRGRPFGINILQGVAQKLHGAQVQIDADTATLITVGNPPFKLRVVDRQWRMDGAFLAQSSLRGLSIMAAATQRAFERIRAEAEAGVYATRQDCLDAASNAVNEETQLAAKGAGPIFTNLTLTTTQVEGPSPREASKAYAAAVRAGDAKTARDLSFGTAEEIAAIDAYADFFTAQIELNRAARERFGESAKDLIGNSMLENWATVIDLALLNVKDDAAEIITPNGQVSIRLAVREGRWKLDLSHLWKGRAAEGAVARQREAAIVRQLEKDLRAGEFRSKDDAVLVMHTRLGSTTTRPTTVPVVTADSSAGQVLKAFAAATALGDIDRAIPLMTGSDTELALFKTTLAAWIGQNAVEKIADERLGPGEHKIFPLLLLPDFDQRFRLGLVWESKEVAELRDMSGRPSITLQRVDGSWRIRAKSVLGGEDSVARVVLVLSALRKTRDEIEAGKYATRDEAAIGLARRISQMAAMLPPTTVPVVTNASTPEDVENALTAAVQLGDSAAVAALTVGTGEQMKQLTAMVSVMAAQQRLISAADARFGPSTRPSAELFRIRPKNGAPTKFTVAGDRAEMTQPDGSPAGVLVRVNGQWRRDVDSSPSSSAKLDELPVVEKSIDQGRREIEAGKYGSREEAMSAIARRVGELFSSTRPSVPTSMPALADDAGPRDVVKAFAAAVMLGDAAAAKALVTGPMDDLKMIDAFTGVVQAERALTAAADARFGAAARPLAHIGILEDWPARADTATISIENDIAVMRNTDAEPSRKPMTLRRVDGHWKIVSDTFTGRDDQIIMADSAKAAFDQGRQEIEAAKYADRKAAVAGVQKLLAAAMNRAAATTREAAAARAATRPATAPN